MRVPALVLTLILAVGISAISEEIQVPHWKASTQIEGARFVVGQEIVIITIEKAKFDPKNHITRRKGWGWDTRIELNPDRGENRYLVGLSITVDGSRFVVPHDHLIDLYNPSSNRLSVTRNAKTNALQVTITGGHTPDNYDVTFCFDRGKYLRREFAYVESAPEIGKRDASKVEIYKGEPQR